MSTSPVPPLQPSTKPRSRLPARAVALVALVAVVLVVDAVLAVVVVRSSSAERAVTCACGEAVRSRPGRASPGST